ncbi:hypothetical protein ACFQ3P_13745 [Paraburkholderia sabiae]|uniref:Uncharacterized protein n=1 Tax=Paraburkholderia sabiae TaxID=273251 RepID=A0ABU9QD60_9BURK|nr:hypothetical protein [Paraburkholderia sabiae]WJZ76162.1 hypothetical protein QEN71_10285 [Paraburkholderia sabiae]
MSLLDELEARAMEAGQTVGMEFHGHLLAYVLTEVGACWVIDGELIDRETAQAILEAATT